MSGTTAPSPPRSIVIVGGGVIGVCCAYYLARRGASVTVLERDDIAKGASFGNAGAITPGHVPINKPGRVAQALRSLNRPTHPLYVAPRLDPALARWMWDFARHCTAAHLETSMGIVGPLGHITERLFHELMSEERLECGYRAEGRYDVFLTERALAAATAEAALTRRHGFESVVLSGAEVREREPALTEAVVGGVYDAGSSIANPYRFVVELADRARRRGASIRTGCSVREVRVRSGRVEGVQLADGEVVTADVVILAGGAYTVELTRPLGIRLPLQPAKGYHRDRALTDGATPALRRACLLGEFGVFCTPLDGFVRFAGTLEFSGVNERIRRPRLEQLTNAARSYFKGMGDAAAISEWCGLRPCLPDGLPAIGPVPRVPGLFLATGHAMMGLTLGPVTGQLMAEYVLDGAPSLDLRLLRADRF
jgi:D-amino-acid dehydrogenase